MSLNFLSQLGLQFQVGPMTTTLMGLKGRSREKTSNIMKFQTLQTK